MKRILLLLIACTCIGCWPFDIGEPLDIGSKYQGYWLVKNNTTFSELRVSHSLYNKVSILAGDSTCFFFIESPYKISCDLLYTRLYDRQGEEPSFSITDSSGIVLKCWRISELGSEPHHFFDVQSWQKYEKKGSGNVHNWVYTITNEDLKNE